MIDLHTHSRFSDGSDSPATLAREARRIGLRAIALTDHDTTASHDEMAAACAAAGVEYVTGIELSVLDDEFPRSRPDGTEAARNVHLLAYFCPLDPASPFQRALLAMREDRESRNERLVARLHELGFTALTLDHVLARARGVDSIGRPHFAEALFALYPERLGENTPENWNRLFKDYLGDGGAAYIPRATISITNVVEAAGPGTVFSVAHPHLNYLENWSTAALDASMPEVLASLRRRGVAGVEAHYGSLPAGVRALMVKLARDAGLIPTGGSDYHGTFKEVRLGVGLYGDLAVPDEVLEELKAAR